MPRSSTHLPVHLAPHRSAILAGEELALNIPLDISRVAGDIPAVCAYDLVHGGQGIVGVIVQLVRFVLRSVAPTVERVHRRVGLFLQMRRLALEFVRNCNLGIQLGSQRNVQLVMQILLHCINLEANLGHVLQRCLSLIAQLLGDASVCTRCGLLGLFGSALRQLSEVFRLLRIQLRIEVCFYTVANLVKLVVEVRNVCESLIGGCPLLLQCADHLLCAVHSPLDVFMGCADNDGEAKEQRQAKHHGC
mmetsp:Transcript_46447/g.122700  ORF Transcript_46447/g.122700 Transcript_46447/m.122700 type:complete len:248 (+) Transcript_46447:442-1185(+)